MCGCSQANAVNPERPSELSVPQPDCQHMFVDISHVIAVLVFTVFTMI